MGDSDITVCFPSLRLFSYAFLYYSSSLRSKFRLKEGNGRWCAAVVATKKSETVIVCLHGCLAGPCLGMPGFIERLEIMVYVRAQERWCKERQNLVSMNCRYHRRVIRLCIWFDFFGKKCEFQTKFDQKQCGVTFMYKFGKTKDVK